jgi:immune inhibitor A
MNNSVKKTWMIILAILLILCFCIILVVGGLGGAAFYFLKNPPRLLSESGPTLDQWLPTLPGVDPYGPTPIIPTPDIVRDPITPGAYDTLRNLEESIVPNNDLAEIAQRLEGKGEIPVTTGDQVVQLEKGAKEKFWVGNEDTHEHKKIDATLAYTGENIYFWVEDGVDFNKRDLENLADEFDKKIYPTNREFFGSEYKPGVDNDPHIYILFASGLGDNIAGYFSSIDSVNPLAHEYSNGHEMIYFSADNVGLGEEFTYGVLAHEFQHMIHWYQDRNESSWLNEGFSELSAFLNGYDIGGFDYAFISNPDLQLNDWPNDPDATTPHYGAGFMFVTYFLDRFGEKATQALVADKDNGMDSVDGVLKTLAITDPETSQSVTADSVFADWVVANYLMDGNVADGRYTYHNYPQAPKANDTEGIYLCPMDWQERTVSQYGTDYIKFTCTGTLNLMFEGSTGVGVVPQDAYSGYYAFWSNKGDESDMTLTQEFDFTDTSGPLTLTYKTWYDLETDYDYIYLEASEDGQTWKILDTPSCTTDDPSGNSYGCGYNGTTDGYIEEKVDISQFAGKKVRLRFEYITDAAVNGEGFLLDDVTIPEVNYETDFEKGNGGWEGSGFVRIENRLPQTYIISLIKNGSVTNVERITLNDDQTYSLPIEIGNSVNDVVLVVSGSTRFTRQTASYRFKLE